MSLLFLLTPLALIESIVNPTAEAIRDKCLSRTLVSSTAALSGFSTRYNDKGDIVLFHSVVEISGLSAILRNVIDRAACSIMGRLLEKYKPEIAHIGFKRGRGLAGPGLE